MSCGKPHDIGARQWRAVIGCCWLFVAILAGVSSHAASLGELVVVSKAGEPLDARIALVGAESLQPHDITVALGSKEDFGILGLERFGYLESLRFEVAPPLVLVSSGAPIADAYLNFLVRLTWRDGTVLREYAVLLDAQGSAPDEPQAPVSPDSPAEPPSVPTAQIIIVQPNETLWSIAAANLLEGMNEQQLMLMILQDNPHAFVANNINGLEAGAVLRLPAGAATTSLSPQEAIDETGRQNEAWGTGGGGRLRIIDSAGDGPTTEAVAEPEMRSPPPKSVAEPPPQPIAAGVPTPEPPLADLLQDARRQVREQARLLQRREDEIARLNRELAALQASRVQERRQWLATLERWRIAALVGLLPTAGLVAVGLVALRRRQVARRAQSSDAPDYDFGAPIADGRVKLNLAKAHIDLEDRASARDLLEEVLASGTDEERSEAQTLLDRLAEGPSPP